MEKYYDRKSIKQLGKKLKDLRESKGYSMADVSAMTGFSVNTISAIEKGKDTVISYIIAVCQSLTLHPSELFKINLELKPRFKLPPDRTNRPRTTSRLTEIVENTDFFNTPQLVGSVAAEFKETYGVKPNSSELSAGLRKLVDEGKLEFEKMGRLHRYSKPSKI